MRCNQYPLAHPIRHWLPSNSINELFTIPKKLIHIIPTRAEEMGLPPSFYTYGGNTYTISLDLAELRPHIVGLIPDAHDIPDLNDYMGLYRRAGCFFLSTQYCVYKITPRGLICVDGF